MNAVLARAPGKVILIGEHSAVYGRPALVAAVGCTLDVRLRALEPDADGPAGLRFEAGEGTIPRHVSFEALREAALEARAAWERAPGSTATDRPERLLEIAFGEALLACDEDDVFESASVSVESGIPVGAGFGSSAALACASAAAWLAWTSRPAGPDAVEPIAMEVERRQHGRPSGIDHATVLRGGLLHARTDPRGARSLVGLETDPARIAKWRLYDTGTPVEPTGTMVERVGRRIRALGFEGTARLDEMAQAVEVVRTALSGAREECDLIEAVRRFHACLVELGAVTAEVADRVAAVERAGGAAKISGAGGATGPAAGALLVYHAEPGALRDLEALRDLPRLEAPLGVSGLTVEELR